MDPYSAAAQFGGALISDLPQGSAEQAMPTTSATTSGRLRNFVSSPNLWLGTFVFGGAAAIAYATEPKIRISGSASAAGIGVSGSAEAGEE